MRLAPILPYITVDTDDGTGNRMDPEVCQEQNGAEFALHKGGKQQEEII